MDAALGRRKARAHGRDNDDVDLTIDRMHEATGAFFRKRGLEGDSLRGAVVTEQNSFERDFLRD